MSQTVQERHRQAIGRTVEIACHVLTDGLVGVWKRLEHQAGEGGENARAALENVQRLHTAIAAELRRCEQLEQQVLARIETGVKQSREKA